MTAIGNSPKKGGEFWISYYLDHLAKFGGVVLDSGSRNVSATSGGRK